MAFWQRFKQFGSCIVILIVSCLVLEQVLYSLVVPGYFKVMFMSPAFWGIFSAVCFYLLWRIDDDFFIAEGFSEYHLPYETNFMSHNYSHHLRELIMGKLS